MGYSVMFYRQSCLLTAYGINYIHHKSYPVYFFHRQNFNEEIPAKVCHNWILLIDHTSSWVQSSIVTCIDPINVIDLGKLSTWVLVTGGHDMDLTIKYILIR